MSLDNRPSWKYTFWTVIHEFFDKSSIHGAKYTVRKGFNSMERAFWVTAVSVAAWLAWETAFDSISGRQVDITILDLDIELQEMPFPGVVVCPLSSIRRTYGLDYLRRFLAAENNVVSDSQMLSVLRMIQMFRFPIMSRIKNFVADFNDLVLLEEAFSNLNITDLAVKALPPCEEVIKYCVWKKVLVNCCELFHLQFTDFGYCYSFNSFSSVYSGHCLLQDDFQPQQPALPECILEKNDPEEGRAGLKIAVQATSPSEMVLDEPWLRGCFIDTFSPVTLPEPGNGYYVTGSSGHIAILISRSITKPTPELAFLTPDTRGCWFSSERSRQMLTVSYNSDVCAMECRMMYVARWCNCRPHMIHVKPNSPLGHNAVCSPSKMPCVSRLAGILRHFDPPTGTPGFGLVDTITGGGVNCTGCNPACYNDHTQSMLKRYTDAISIFKSAIDIDGNLNYSFETELHRSTINLSTISVRYNFHRPNVLFLRRKTPNLLDNLAVFGGIAGLFLGVGLLSVFEMSYFTSRGLAVFLHLFYSRQRRIHA